MPTGSASSQVAAYPQQGETALQQPLLITGAPGSPYTRKMLAALRYRRIRYIFVSDLAVSERLAQPRVKLWPVVYLPAADGASAPITDSTPILRHLESLHSLRPIIPPDPVLALLDAIVEDYGDEWLTKAMFHYRWTQVADIENAARVLPNWFETPLDDARLASEGDAFSARQISRLGVVGSSAETAEAIESSFRSFIEIFERHLSILPFLWGDRPGAADFAIMGQLTQLALFDPTPAALVRERAPRVLAWTIAMEDLSGWDREGWSIVEALPDTMDALLAEIGATYVPLLLGNAQAIDRGQAELETLISGSPWRQPVFPYQRKCLQALRSQYSELTEADRTRADDLLAGSGCERLFYNVPDGPDLTGPL